MSKLESNYRKAEESPGFMLWKAANVLQRLHGDCLRELDMTPTQFSFMTCLVYLHQFEPVTPSAIVAHTGMDKMMVSDLIKTLIRKRLATRKPNHEDGRSFFVAPTPLGTRTTNSAVRKIEAVDRDFFGSMEDPERFHADLIALAGAEALAARKRSAKSSAARSRQSPPATRRTSRA